jgi:acyl-CoA hydrolase
MDANHHGTLYAGSLLRLALEAGYATAWRHVGHQANLVLRRVLNLECLRPVPVGTVIEIEGTVLHRAQAYLVTGLIGTPQEAGQGPWMEALLGFAQVDDAGRPTGLPEGPAAQVPASEDWRRLDERLHKLLHLR